MMATETDLLLPRDKPAPEIHGSSSRIINVEATGVDAAEIDIDERPRIGVNEIIGFCAAILTVSFILIAIIPDGFFKHLFPGWHQPLTLDGRVSKILTDTPLIDGHNDLAILLRVLYNNHINDEKFRRPFEDGGMPFHVDIPRLKKGMVGGTFWAAFAPCPANGSDFSEENYEDTITFTYAQLDLLSRLQSLYPFLLLPPNLNASSALHAFHSTTPHPLISPLAIEGLHQIGVSTPFATLRSYTHLGIKYATLTHNCHNVFADAALTSLPPTPSHPHGKIQKAVPLHGGVSSLGRDLITEMNRLGLIVDLSHTSAETMRDVLGGTSSWDGSRAPIIFSHSSAYSLCPHPRNVPDSILDLVKAKRGLVMVNFSPDFISCIPPSPPRDDGLPDPYPKNETLAQVADHVMYIGQRIGWGHVGFGSDFDGIEQTPRGLEDVSKYPQLVKELLDRGVSDEEAGMVVGGNLLRVWREVDEVAEEMRREGAIPREDDLPNLRPE